MKKDDDKRLKANGSKSVRAAVALHLRPLVVGIASVVLIIVITISYALLLMIPGRTIWALIAAHQIWFSGTQGVAKVVDVSSFVPKITSGDSTTYYITYVEFRKKTKSFTRNEPLGKKHEQIRIRYPVESPHLFVPYTHDEGYWYTFATLATLNGNPVLGQVVGHFLVMMMMLSGIPFAFIKLYAKYEASIVRAGSLLNAWVVAVLARLRIGMIVTWIRNLLFTFVLLTLISVIVVYLFKMLLQASLRYEPNFVAIAAGGFVFVGTGLLFIAVSIAFTLKKHHILPGLQQFIADIKLIWSLGAVLVFGWITVLSIFTTKSANLADFLARVFTMIFAG